MSPSVDGKAIIRYFEGSSFVGSRESYCCGYAAADGTRSSAYWPNTAYFCPNCGEIWGRAVYDYQFAYQPIPQAPWVVESRRCPQHGDGYFLSGIGGPNLLSCSRELLAREALLLCLSHRG